MVENEPTLMTLEAKKKSILLIDDEDDILCLMEEMITQLDYNVVCAKTVPSALIKINNQYFILILLDLCLKKVSGLRVIDQIRRNHLSMNNNTPIILHSGHIEPSIMKKYSHEIDDALVKPVSLEILQKKLLAWDEKKHSVLPIKNTYVQEYVQKKLNKKSS